MLFLKVDYGLINLLLSNHPALRLIASDHLIHLSHKSIFISLVTRTGLPMLTADIIVEIKKLYRNKRRARYQNCASQRQLQFRSVNIQ